MDWGEFARVLGEQLAPILATIIVGIIGALAAVGAAYLKKWTGVQVSEAQQRMFAHLAQDAADFAEEQARKALKAGDKTPDSDTKMETAVKFVFGQAEAMGLPGVARDRLVEMIESYLGFTRPPDEMVSSVLTDHVLDDPEDTKLDLPQVKDGKLIGGDK
jgi:hypothetical protein